MVARFVPSYISSSFRYNFGTKRRYIKQDKTIKRRRKYDMQEDKTKSRKLNMQLERQNENSKIRHAGRQNEKTTCRTTKTKR